MKRGKLIFLCALSLAICLPGMASAYSVVDDPSPAGSMAQVFQEAEVGNFVVGESFMVPPSGTSDFEVKGGPVGRSVSVVVPIPGTLVLLGGGLLGLACLGWRRSRKEG
jgi:hypothetical protein